MQYRRGNMKRPITIRLPDDLRKLLDEISKQEHLPVSDLVRESIRRYAAVYRFRQLRNKVLPFAEAQGLLTDDDIFENLK
jgi:predicted transcriptional regulator